MEAFYAGLKLLGINKWKYLFVDGDVTFSQNYLRKFSARSLPTRRAGGEKKNRWGVICAAVMAPLRPESRLIAVFQKTCEAPNKSIDLIWRDIGGPSASRGLGQKRLTIRPIFGWSTRNIS